MRHGGPRGERPSADKWWDGVSEESVGGVEEAVGGGGAVDDRKARLVWNVRDHTGVRRARR